MRFLKSMAVLSVSLMLGACATPLRVALSPEQRAKITEVKAHLPVVQDEVIVAVPASNVSGAMGGGLIGAVIDSKITNSRVKDTQQVMGPFYAAIEDFDYRAEFQEAMKRDLAAYPFKVTSVSTSARSLRQVDLTYLREDLLPHQALLVVWPSYSLSADFRALDTEVTVTMWAKGSDNQPLQRSILHYQSKPVGSGQANSVQAWAAENATVFRSAVRESISETIRLILVDHDAGVVADAKPGEIRSFKTAYADIKGRLLKEANGRVVVLGEDQKIYSLPAAPVASTTSAQR